MLARERRYIKNMVEKGNCTVLKVFPISNSGLETHSTMKFPKKKKIQWTIRQKEKQESSGVIAKIQHITARRVDQLWKIYQDTGTIPIIGQLMDITTQQCRGKRQIMKNSD